MLKSGKSKEEKVNGNSNLTLVVLAAGMGSRYGGLKQMDSFTPEGDTIIDFSLYDALQAGFGKIVFIIQKSFEREFKEMVVAVRNAEKMIGEVSFKITDKIKSQRDFSRSLYIVKNIKKGELITEANVRSIRPGFGLHPKHYGKILGKKVNKDLKKGTAMSFEYIK